MSARVVVVGGGIAGLTIAWELARSGAEVTLVRASRPATSVVAAGMLAPMPEADGTRGLLRLGVEALRHYPGFLETLAGDTERPVGYARSGLLRLAADDAAADSLRSRVGTYEAAGMPSQWLDRRSVRQAAPGLPEGLAGGLLSFDEAQVQPEWLLAALEEAAFRRGVELRGATARDLGGTPGAAEVRLDDGEVIGADQVVLAAGAWSGELGGAWLPVRPVKGQLLVFRGEPGPTPIIYSAHNYILTKADGSVVLGGTVEEAGFSLDADTAADALRGLLPGLWPALNDAPAETRVGLRPASPDGLPIHGAVPGAPGVYAFTGHYRNGFLLAPHGARLAAREILEGEAQELFAPLRPGRFREP